MNVELIIQIIGAIGSLITVVIVPFIFWKIDKNEKKENEIGKRKLAIDEAENKMNKYSHLLTKETAKAVLTGKCNGALTKAIENFDKAYENLSSEKDKALRELKEKYK